MKKKTIFNKVNAASKLNILNRSSMAIDFLISFQLERDGMWRHKHLAVVSITFGCGSLIISSEHKNERERKRERNERTKKTEPKITGNRVHKE